MLDNFPLPNIGEFEKRKVSPKVASHEVALNCTSSILLKCLLISCRYFIVLFIVGNSSITYNM